MKEIFIYELNKIFEEDQIRYKEPMIMHTSLRIGGEADYMVLPSSVDQIKQVVILCKRSNMPYYIIETKQFTYMSDHGYRGLIVKLGDRFSEVRVEEDGIVHAQAGCLCQSSPVLSLSMSNSFEFGAGIPGTLGGADHECRSIRRRNQTGFGFGYRNETRKVKSMLWIRRTFSWVIEAVFCRIMIMCLLEATMRFSKGNRQRDSGENS